MNAEFEAFLNSEVGKMYANDTQKLMIYRVDADERESYGYKNMGQTEWLGALLSVPCAERMKQEGKRVEHTGNVRGKLTCGCCERRRYGGVYVVEL